MRRITQDTAVLYFKLISRIFRDVVAGMGEGSEMGTTKLYIRIVRILLAQQVWSFMDAQNTSLGGQRYALVLFSEENTTHFQLGSNLFFRFIFSREMSQTSATPATVQIVIESIDWSELRHSSETVSVLSGTDIADTAPNIDWVRGRRFLYVCPHDWCSYSGRSCALCICCHVQSTLVAVTEYFSCRISL